MLANEHSNVETCPIEEAFDPFDPAYLADPYPFLAAVRAREPVFYVPQIDVYGVTRYQDIEAVFMNPATFSAAIAQAPLVALSAEAEHVLSEGGFHPLPVMSNLDPPQHARIRKQNVKTFSAPRLAVLEPKRDSLLPWGTTGSHASSHCARAPEQAPAQFAPGAPSKVHLPTERFFPWTGAPLGGVGRVAVRPKSARDPIRGRWT